MTSLTQGITWVLDGDCVYCHDHGVPYNFYVHCTDKSKILSGLLDSQTNQPIYAIDVKTAKLWQLDLTQGMFVSYRQLVGGISKHTAHQLSSLIQRMHWRQKQRFCTQCGQAFAKSSEEWAITKQHCLSCGYVSYPVVQPCVIVAVVRHHPTTGQKQLLLAKHHRHRQSMMYGLLAGFVEVGETLEAAAAREVLEETAITIKDLRYVASQPWPYPSNMMVGFVANYHSGDINIQDDELLDAQFFDINHLPLIPPKGTIAYHLIQQVLTGC